MTAIAFKLGTRWSISETSRMVIISGLYFHWYGNICLCSKCADQTVWPCYVRCDDNTLIQVWLLVFMGFAWISLAFPSIPIPVFLHEISIMSSLCSRVFIMSITWSKRFDGCFPSWDFMNQTDNATDTNISSLQKHCHLCDYSQNIAIFSRIDTSPQGCLHVIVMGLATCLPIWGAEQVIISHPAYSNGPFHFTMFVKSADQSRAG